MQLALPLLVTRAKFALIHIKTFMLSVCLFLRGGIKGITMGGGLAFHLSFYITLNESTAGGDASVEAFST